MTKVIHFPSFGKRLAPTSLAMGIESEDPKLSQSMEEAILWLDHAEIPYFRPSNIQLKIVGVLSFYPNSGTINFDNRPALPQRGLAGLRELLQAQIARELPPLP